MDKFIAGLTESLSVQNAWELVAVVFGVAYLLLAVRQNRLCWCAAFVSTSISIVMFWRVDLPMQSLLNAYYMAMAVYGWIQWSRNGAEDEVIVISRWSATMHLKVITSVVVASALCGYLLSRYSDAAWPYADSFITLACFFSTYMVVKKVLENWIYWFVLDAMLVFLCLDRGLYFYTLLYAIYMVIAIFGFMKWRRDFQQLKACPA